jgi:hypothetical protein
MKNIFYTNSKDIAEKLLRFEQLHTKIYALPLPPKMEIKLQYEAGVNRMYHTLRLSNIDSRRSRINEIIRHPTHLTRYERMILDMQYYFELIYYDWKYNPNLLTVDTVLKMVHAIEKKNLTLNTNQISNYLEYIELEQSPLIQSALAYILFINQLNNPIGSLMSILISWLYLFKSGYDFRRIVSFQRQFMNDRTLYYSLISQTRNQDNITDWIHYYCESFIHAIESELLFIEDQIKTPSFSDNILTPRHISILALFSEPQSMITNRMIQKQFKVSQVTASRELSYLTSIGLLFSLRKGRSTAYTKV